MTTSLGERGQIVIPKTVREIKGFKRGDDFEILYDEAEPDIIRLRHIQARPNQGLVDHLLGCPDKGSLRLPERRREKMRKIRL